MVQSGQGWSFQPAETAKPMAPSMTASEHFFSYMEFVNDVYDDWPVLANALGWDDLCLSWQMEYYERTALIAVVSGLKPAVAVEVGTHSGGSLAVLSRFARRVYSLDIEPTSSSYLAARFDNVEFVVGDSKQTLGKLLTTLPEDPPGPLFVLIDGDHRRAGVREDLKTVLKLRPSFPMVIMCHDSFNPDCRAGILEATWAENPHVHLVEIDFVQGSIFDRSTPPLEMWGGFCLGLLLPEERNGPLSISQRHELLFRTTFRASSHAKHSPLARALRKMRRVRAASRVFLP